MPNIEDVLRQAIADGKFDNLPGKGKALNLDNVNPHTDPEWELAYHMLKEAGYTLPWIEFMREIESDLESARNDLSIAYHIYQPDFSDPQHAASAAADWELSQLAFKDKLDGLNKRIRTVNLQVPNARFQRPLLNFTQELQMLNSTDKTP